MGMSAHDMEDQAFDELFVSKASKVAPSETPWYADATSDFVVLAKYNRWGHVPVYIVPVKDLAEYFCGYGP